MKSINIVSPTSSSFPTDAFFSQAQKFFIGKNEELKTALCCLLANGHLLIEDLPGMGKTSFVLILSKLLDLPMKRIQFTNDLLPADILGLQVLSEDRKSFHFHPGPIFSELVLADELNRATPKTQSALLQAMEEHSVSIDGRQFPLPEPFFLIATQNPNEHAGTFPLPESQMDRFMMRITLGYPSKQSELEVLKQGDVRQKMTSLNAIMSRQDFTHHQKAAADIFVSEPVYEYVQSILQATRNHSAFLHGLSPRAGILLLQAAKAWCYLQERNHVLPEDVKAVAKAVLSHRLATPKNHHTSVSNDSAIQALLETITVP